MTPEKMTVDYLRMRPDYLRMRPDYLRMRPDYLRMIAYSTRERKTRSMQASSHTSIAVTALDTGIRVLPTQNIKIILEGKMKCRLQIRSPNMSTTQLVLVGMDHLPDSGH
jgi:hypothetical protein